MTKPRCYKCKGENNLRVIYTRVDGSTRNICLACQTERARLWRERPGNREKANANATRWHRRHPERARLVQNAYRERNREAINLWNREYNRRRKASPPKPKAVNPAPSRQLAGWNQQAKASMNLILARRT